MCLILCYSQRDLLVLFNFDKKPLNVAEDEVLIEMKNVGICGSDVHYWTHGRGARFVPK